ncbi:hypothetical protein JKP88DRAFT_159084 [Tribonema minus]|uniref:Peroxisomal membrane protein 2 n=1 Tax=Tribonema minus TaxID=303371 RepID=A0A835YN24_9STRA|nr:hypothetical protein JKP88DRAFT_159084 [Tribonema minus]
MVDPASLWADYQGALEAAPLLTKSITAAVLFSGADLCAQQLERSKAEEPKDLEFARSARFFALGLFAQAPWNHYFYMYLDKALPPTEEVFTSTTAIKLALDQGVQAPIFTVIIFAFLGLLEGKSLAEVKQKLNESYGSTMIANWKLWIPASFVNLAFCPPPLRVLFTNVVFFCWSIFLSIVVNAPQKDTEEAASDK